MNSLLLIGPAMMAALGVSLLLRFIWAARSRRDLSTTWREPSAANELLYVTAHAALGAGIGLLFWLSWGFTALVEISWWQRGLVFGLMNAVIFSVLPLLIVRSLLRTTPPFFQLLVVETCCTCVAASLACSWAWSQSL